MGVGKTLQAIALAAAYSDEWPLLVVAPASLRLVWAEELEAWLPRLRPSLVHVIEGRGQRLTGRSDAAALPPVTITSFEMMKRLSCAHCCGGGGGVGSTGTAAAASSASGSGGAAAATAGRCAGPAQCMAAAGWGVVIVDESHNLRTTNGRKGDAAQTEAAVAAIKRARRALLLSGTPSLSRPYDLYRQVDALRPGLLGGRDAFAARYCERRLVPFYGRGARPGGMRWSTSGVRAGLPLRGCPPEGATGRAAAARLLQPPPPLMRALPPAHTHPVPPPLMYRRYATVRTARPAVAGGHDPPAEARGAVAAARQAAAGHPPAPPAGRTVRSHSPSHACAPPLPAACPPPAASACERDRR